MHIHNIMCTRLLATAGYKHNVLFITVTLNLLVMTVYSWTSWSPWLPSCDAVEVHRSHSCVVPSADSLYCSTCGCENTTVKQSKTSNLTPCCSSEQVDVADHQEWVKFDKGQRSDEEGIDSEQEVFEI